MDRVKWTVIRLIEEGVWNQKHAKCNPLIYGPDARPFKNNYNLNYLLNEAD